MHLHGIVSMMTSSNGSIFRVTGHLCGEFTGHQWIPLTKTSDAELWCFLWSASWTNGWVNNREAGNLRRHRAHYDVIVMPYCAIHEICLQLRFPCFCYTKSACVIYLLTFFRGNSYWGDWEDLQIVYLSQGSGTKPLTHLPLDKMAAISQTIFSYAFSWIKVLYFDWILTEFCS